MIPEVKMMDEQMITTAHVQREARTGRINLADMSNDRKPITTVMRRPQLNGGV
jgi:hypothetical protein